jgi:hypothetical protein
MKRFVLALFVGGMVFGAVVGLAASLGVEGGTIQAGADTDLACDEDGVQVLGWNLDTDTTLVDSIRVGGIDAGCQQGDTDLFVNLTHYGAKMVGGRYDDIDSTEVSVTLDFPVGAWAITDIEIFIEGEAND